MDFREAIDARRTKGELQIRDDRLDPVRQAARALGETGGGPALLERVGGKRVAAGVATRELLGAVLGTAPADLADVVYDRLGAPRRDPIEGPPLFEQARAGHGGFAELPVLTYFEGDGGPFITGGIVFINDPDRGPNASYHRAMILDDRRAVVRVVEGRGLHRALRAGQGQLEAAMVIGAPPAMLLAAALPLAEQEDELSAANSLCPVAVTDVGGIRVPASSEYVLFGRFTGALEKEGPFVDITGTRDGVRRQPVFQLERLYMRHDPLYHAVLPAGPEHRFLMGFPREAAMRAAAKGVCPVRDARLTDGGCGWLNAVISIVKDRETDALKAASAALNAHPSCKHVTVVDDDIDPGDPVQVEWALATRFQADRDLTVLYDQPSSSLDPSAQHVEGQKSVTSKMILDATRKAQGGPYERVAF